MRSLPPLGIRLKKHSDHSASITCTRADGSVTWQRQPGKLGLVFPQHDLTHFAVETILGYHQGFYGLVADGWEISDFAAPYARGEIPLEAREVELLVGCFDAERRHPDEWSVDDFNAHAAVYTSSTRFASKVEPRLLTAHELDAVRTRRRRLLDHWNTLEAGGALELVFDRAAV